jgi:diguanylate cyclase (GGDEF)-like protein
MTSETGTPLCVLCAGFAAAAPALPATDARHFPDHDSLAQSAATGGASSADAWLLRTDDLAALAAWPPLAPALLHTAVVVVGPGDGMDLALRLVALGVQDVIPAAEAEPARLVRALRLAVERKRLEVATRRAYATDLSTGLPHHQQLLEHMTHLLALREREPAPMALIVLRVQGLGVTARQLGSEAAHVLRRKAAVRLRAALRASDVVASISDDTFAVLLAWIDAPEDADRVAAKLAQALAEPLTVAGRPQRLQVAVGLARTPEHGKQAEALLQRALAQAAGMAVVGGTAPARAADRGPDAAANDEA